MKPLPVSAMPLRARPEEVGAIEAAVLAALKRDKEPARRLQFHREILAAIRSGKDAEAMRRHLQGTQGVLGGRTRKAT